MSLIPVRLATVLLVAGISGSSVAGLSRGSDSPFAGTWVQRGATLGTSFVLTLAVDGTKVTGTGTYSKEGGQSGKATETGSISGETLQLAITYGSDEPAQFQGRMASASELSGSLHFGPPQSLTPSAIVKFDRKK